MQAHLTEVRVALAHEPIVFPEVPGLEPQTDLACLALAWTRLQREAGCDVQERWAHGTVLRASAYPTWWDRNLVRVEEPADLTAEALLAFAEEALSGLRHRLVALEDATAGEGYRPAFEAAGYRTTRLVWMHHESPWRVSAPAGVVEVAFEQVAHLRTAWLQEDFPGLDSAQFHRHLREFALAHGGRTLASFDSGRPVGLSTLDPLAGQVEIGAVYVLPRYRGRGHGTALTRAAIAAAAGHEHVWISADADDRPRHLYARLSFRPALRTVEFMRPG